MNLGSVPSPALVTPVASPAPKAFAPTPLPEQAASSAPAQPSVFEVPPPEEAQPAERPARVEASTALRIEYNVDAGRFVHLSVDPGSGQVVSQVPTEEALRRITWLRAQLDAQHTSGQG